jgi:thioredoxin-related protein
MLIHSAFANEQAIIDKLAFNDTPLKEPLEYPNWFKLSFLNLNDSLEEALNAGKKGIIVYFGRTNCAYCKAQLLVNWGIKDIVNYTQKHYDVIAIDVRGQRTVTDFNGKIYTEKDFATHMKTNFTPSLLFYEKHARLALKISGYRPPYQFRASLEYVADAHYNKEYFGQYLSRAEKAFGFGQKELNDHSAFTPPPYILNRRSVTNKPLIVFFEHSKCHACDVMHGGPMSEKNIKSQLEHFDVVQINIELNTVITTPSGQQTTARKWARKLNLNFAPTMIFFDTDGAEIIRVDSVIRLYRMKRLLNYILSKSYLKYPTYQIWQDANKES